MKRNRASSPRRQPRGTAAVELALVLPLILILLFGIIEFSSVFYVRHNMVKAARAGARSLAVQDGTQDEARAITLRNLEHLPPIPFEITITEPGQGDPDEGQVTVEVQTLLADAAFGDPFGLLRSLGAKVTSQVTMRKEG